tara:strand:+ start:332 stop:1510 length:1179 start_codon:yes stop_codon:yes gene_type:complete
MTITLQTFSGGEQVSGTKLDANFTAIESFLLEGIKSADIDSGDFDRYFLKRWTNGRLNSATVGSNPLIDVTYFSNQMWDYLIPDITRVRSVPVADLSNQRIATSRENFPFELLGFPGPSYLIYDVAEAGSDVTGMTFSGLYDIPGVKTALGIDNDNVTGLYPHNWFPKDQCWSRWLTIPHASMKIYVPDNCVAHIHGAFSMIPGPGGTCEFVALGSWDPYNAPHQQLIRCFKIGLFVDTNPQIRTDFANTNTNVLDPTTGSMAPYVSFKKVTEKSVKQDLRTQENVRGVVALKGGGWYNISMKYKDAGTFGYKDTSDTSQFNTYWADEDTAIWPSGNFNGGSYDALASARSGIGDLFWESVQLNVEFYYGRDIASVTDVAHADMQYTPDLDY